MTIPDRWSSHSTKKVALYEWGNCIGAKTATGRLAESAEPASITPHRLEKSDA